MRCGTFLSEYPLANCITHTPLRPLRVILVFSDGPAPVKHLFCGEAAKARPTIDRQSPMPRLGTDWRIRVPSPLNNTPQQLNHPRH